MTILVLANEKCENNSAGIRLPLTNPGKDVILVSLLFLGDHIHIHVQLTDRVFLLSLLDVAVGAVHSQSGSRGRILTGGQNATERR